MIEEPRRPVPAWLVLGSTALIALALAYGLVLRLWLFAHTPVNSDWAVVGLMARSILSGHFATFYWGQQYGGVEPYLVAPAVWLSGGSPWAIEVVPALLSALAAVAAGLVVATATGRRRLGWLAAAAVWVWPYAVVWNSVREYGFRGVTMACGLLLLYLVVRIHRRGSGAIAGAILGVIAGLGWWSSPEIAYFAVPVAVVLLASWGRLFARGRRLSGPWQPLPVLAAVLGAVVGALPWLYTNIGSGFASLQSGSLPSYGGLDYGARLSVFFEEMLPIQLGVRTVPGGAWVGGSGTGRVLYGLVGAVLVVVLVVALLGVRHGRRAAPQLAAAAGVVAFPFLYALVPSTGYWVDGRYGVYLPALLVVTAALALAGPRPPVTAGALPAVAAAAPRAAIAAAAPGATVAAAAPRAAIATAVPPPRGKLGHGRHARSRRRPVDGVVALVVASVGLAGAGVLTVFTARAGGVPADPRTFFSGWRDPEGPIRQVAAAMERHGLHDAYGTYWTAYVLDYLAPGHLVVSPSPLDVVRWPVGAGQVAAADPQAWLFYAPDRLAAAESAFANPETGPGNYTEAQFESLLSGRHVPYTVVHLGVLDAVVPAERVTLPR